MPGFVPFAGRNAIAEMSVGFQFQLPFDFDRVGNVETIKADFARDFPKFEFLQTVILNIGPQQFPFPAPNAGASAGGFMFTRTKNDGTPARILRVMPNTISAHFMEYTSWAEAKPSAIGYISKALNHLPAAEKDPVTAVMMRYVDRFTFDGAPTDARASAIFQRNTAFVAAQIFESDHRWHSNSGWFESLNGNPFTLNSLNVSSSVIQSVCAIIIDHTSIFFLPGAGSPFSALADRAPDRPSLEEILTRQHESNVKVLKNLLNKEALAAIGLT
jgi:uncharacterized protein (TIGR04255 family)